MLLHYEDSPSYRNGEAGAICAGGVVDCSLRWNFPAVALYFSSHGTHQALAGAHRSGAGWIHYPLTPGRLCLRAGREITGFEPFASSDRAGDPNRRALAEP